MFFFAGCWCKPAPCEKLYENNCVCAENCAVLSRRHEDTQIETGNTRLLSAERTGPDQPSKASPFSSVLALAEDQMARQKAILFTKSARLYTRFRVLSLTPPMRYPK